MSRLQIVGDGPGKRQWRKYVSRLGLDKSVERTPWLSQNELVGVFGWHDVLLFPSLHDSGGMVVLEALSRGLPVVCLDLGGPGCFVDGTRGRVIPPAGRSRANVVAALTEALRSLAGDDKARHDISFGALKRASESTEPTGRSKRRNRKPRSRKILKLDASPCSAAGAPGGSRLRRRVLRCPPCLAEFDAGGKAINIEEISWRQGWNDDAQMARLAKPLVNCGGGMRLLSLIEQCSP